MEETEVITVCSKRGDGNPPVTTGIWVRCTKCDCEVWLSYTSVSAVKQTKPEAKIKPHCLYCALPILKSEGATLMPTSNEQAKEIFNHLKK